MRKELSPFYEKVYTVVRRIPKGKVTSYGRIAEMLESRGAARQVGYAMSALKNRENDPRYADVPWQRVVNHEGRIVIKGSEHGRFYQAELLREEGVEVSKELKIDLDKYLWDGLLPHEVREIMEDI
ncbi:MAG: cysteine methyltransferase [Anaerolineales bacterium]|nr:MAG: cysteine methyltransferase [Anaerolineales bacterium]